MDRARRSRSLSVGLYGLLAGLALGLAVFVWHVWSDNAYLYLYFIAMLLLLGGSISALIALAGSWGLPRAIGTLVLAAVASFALVGPLGLAAALADPILAGGNGSQSPCIAEARARQPGRVTPELPRYLPPAAIERASVAGALTQILLPFFAGLVPLALAVRARRPDRTVIMRALAPAAAVTAYVYLRGPGAWCGQLIGLDGLIVVVLGLLWAIDRLHLPGPREVPEQAV